jgi:hypothetical protein
MNYVLVIWLASAGQYTVFEKFATMEACLEKQQTVVAALTQANSKMRTECRGRKPGDVFKSKDVMVSRYVLR